MKSKLYYTWKDFDKDVRILAKNAKGLDIKNIYGVPRGGLVVAVTLSHLLNKPLILDSKKITKKTLVVDDILDSGKTLEKLCRVNHLWPFVLCFNDAKCETNLSRLPDGIVSVRDTDGKWVVFPWEQLKSSKYDGTLK